MKSHDCKHHHDEFNRGVSIPMYRQGDTYLSKASPKKNKRLLKPTSGRYNGKSQQSHVCDVTPMFCSIPGKTNVGTSCIVQ